MSKRPYLGKVNNIKSHNHSLSTKEVMMRSGNKWVTKTVRKSESKNSRKYASALFWVWLIAVIAALALLK